MTRRPSEAIHVATSIIPVRWADLDLMNHVNNTVYFRYFEQARIDWVTALGLPLAFDAPAGMVIVHADCTFLRPVTYPAVCEVRVFIGKPGRSSIMHWYELRCSGDDALYATGSAKLVWIDKAAGRSIPLPEAVRRACSS